MAGNTVDLFGAKGAAQALGLIEEARKGVLKQAETVQQEWADIKADAAQQQAANDAATLEAIEQTRSITGVRPLSREPRRAAADGSYPADPPAIYRVVRGSGIVDVDWDGSAVTAETPAAVTINQLGRVAVDAAYHGVAHGADVRTFMDALSQVSRSGGTLVCPPGVKLIHNGGRLIIEDYKNLRIEGRGLMVEANPNLPQSGQNGGFSLIGLRDSVLLDMGYDGRLDVRDPIIDDMQGGDTNYQNAWSVNQDCDLVELSNCIGRRAMMDAICVSYGPDGLSEKFSNAQPFRPKRITLRNFRAEYGYRQALSYVGVDGLHLIGGTFSRTGALADTPGQRPKRIPPGAGADGEGCFWPAEPSGKNDQYNDNVRFERVLFEENWGIGTMFEMGTRGAVADDCIVRRNGLYGVLFSPKSVACEFVNGVIEDNATRRSDNWEAVVGQPDAVLRNNKIRCGTGNGAIYADFAGGSGYHRYIEENKISVPKPSGAAAEGRVVVNGAFDIVQNNELSESVGYDNNGYGALAVDSPGAIVRNNAVRQTRGGVGVPITVQAAANTSGNVTAGYTRAVYDNSRAARPDSPWLASQAGRGATISNMRWTDLGGEQGRRTYALDCTIAVDYSEENAFMRLALSPDPGPGDAFPNIRNISMVNENDWGQVVTANVQRDTPNAAIVNFGKKDSGTFQVRIIVDYISRPTPQLTNATNWLRNGRLHQYTPRPATVRDVQATAGAATDTTLTYTVTGNVDVPVLNDGEIPGDLVLTLRPGGGNAVIKRITAVSVTNAGAAIPTEPIPGQPWQVRVKLDRKQAYTLAVSVTAEYGMA